MTKRKSADTSLLEWLMGSLGLLVFSALFGLLAVEGLSGASSPPDIQTHVERVSRVSQGYVAEIVVRNAGDTTAADVEIVAELANGEKTSVHFDYLAPHGARRGGVVFRSDPRTTQVRFRPSGYSDP